MAELEPFYDSKKIEAEILEFWKQRKIPEKVLRLKGRKKFSFLEGPPTVNAPPHVGHLRGRTMKDVVLRFRTMQGFWVRRQAGWDCQGLPLEVEVEKELGVKNKKQIEEIGVEKFIQACKQKVSRYINFWQGVDEKLGLWLDYKNAYLTMNPSYIEKVWWLLKKAWQLGYLKKSFGIVAWCPRCSTSLSSHEVSLGYETISDFSIWVEFKLREREESLVVWTTTPWTLVANVAVAVHPEHEYAKVKINNKTFILASQLVENFARKLNASYEILEKTKGSELVGLSYKTPLAEEVPELAKVAHQVVPADFVTLEEGSGCVHVAPAHGPEDFELAQRLKLQVFCPVDDFGVFTWQAGKYGGLQIKEAEKIILQDLEAKGLLLHQEKIRHEYPCCWRCGTPLFYRASEQWYLGVERLKKKLLDQNRKVRWFPEWVGKERFGNWLEAAKDWCVSRKRYWGTPLPIWVCNECKKIWVVGSFKELEKLCKTSSFEPHRPSVDELSWGCECGGRMRRVEEVADCWLDSGCAPFASFEQAREFRKWFPAHFITEAIDQTRGWFYSLLFANVLAFGRSPYRSVLCQEHVLDEFGKKMSKSKGNVIWAEEALQRLGADVYRLYVLSQVAPWETLNFRWKDVEKIKKFLNILWNCCSFFETYAAGFKLRKRVGPLSVEDRWILSRINSLVSEVTAHLERCELHLATRDLMDFIVNDLSHYYIKLIRDRVWIYADLKQKQTALTALYTVLETFSRLLAPFAPFAAEKIYQQVVRKIQKGPESIHLCRWPRVRRIFLKGRLEEQMELAKEVVEACRYARQKASLKLRWPVEKVVVVTRNAKLKSAVKTLNSVLARLCNAKKVLTSLHKPLGEFVEVDLKFGKVVVQTSLSPELLEEALVRELIRKVQDLRKKFGLKVEELISLTLQTDEETSKKLEKFSSVIKKEVGAKKIIFGKIEGKYRGRLEFKNKAIQISF